MSYTYLLEQGEESSAASFWDIPQSVLSRLNLTAEKSCFKDNETESCQSSQFGMMSPHSTEPRGEGKSMSSAEASLARTSQSPEPVKDSLASEAGYGVRCGGSLARFDRATSSWKTHQLSLLAEVSESLPIWPRWAMWDETACWELSTPALRTSESESGSWPTPTVQDSKNNGAQSQMERNTKPLNAEVGGPLNPTWVEWLMGWPLGWTDCDASATDKFQQWLHAHGEFLEVEND